MQGVEMSLWSRLQRLWKSPAPSTPQGSLTGPEVLLEHSNVFEKGVFPVTKGVWVAIGYGLANVVILEGDEGVVLVDSLGSRESAEEVKEAITAVVNKPVHALILTHNHTDHIFGGGVLAPDPDIPVVAHETTSALIDKIVSRLRPIITRRSMRQFGNYLQGSSDFVNSGIGPFLDAGPGKTLALRRPTQTLQDKEVLEYPGMRLQLLHAPGETDDQLVIWWPEKRVLVGADNFYKAFPNLYAIRGTAHRDVMQWVASLDTMRSLRPAFLVPCHTRPVVGEELIFETLTCYRDAIQYVHDQTVRWMNKGLTPDEIVGKVRLPEHLRSKPYLQELYGSVDWSVRSVFQGYLGWFDGNPTHLHPLPPQQKAERLVRLAGGIEAFREQTRQAVQEKEWQWVLELTDSLLCLDKEDSEARGWRIQALRGRGLQESSANGRNYYLTRAREWTSRS